MDYLLDTHILLWWLTEPDKLSKNVKAIISNKENVLFISSASFWEMAIKKSIGKLTLPHNLLSAIAAESFKFLPIMPEDAMGIADLPLLHADPFDRLLIIQAKLHGLVLITNDKKISAYSVPIIMA